MKTFLLIIYLLGGTLASYSQRKESIESIEKLRLNYTPKQSKYKFKKTKTYSDLIDTAAIYLMSGEDSWEFNGKVIKDSSITFIRFYSNGICYMSLSYLTTPPATEYNKKDYGGWGMYKVKGNKIIIEYYVNGTPPPHFYYLYGMIEGDKIHFYKYRMGRLFTNRQPKINTIARKVKFNFTDYVINWE